VYYLDALPVRLAAGDIGVVVATALAVTLAASIFPARAAGRLDPVEAIRYG
jgi:lipoprotein-releasing system permease protein